MLRLLAFLWSGCWHKWETIDYGSLVYFRGGLPHGRWFHERCERCGKNRYHG